MNVQELLDAGFTKIRDNMAAAKSGEDYKGSYQKRIDDELGARYHITVGHYFLNLRTRPSVEFFSPHVQFNRNGTTFNVDMLHRDETVAEVEAFYEDLWNSLKVDYYDGPSRDEAPVLALPAPR